MKRDELYFDLPHELIAQKPAEPRDSCRLMVLNRADHSIKDDLFYNIGNYLKSGDVLVFNESKVIPARLAGEKEVLLLKDLGGGRWEVLIRGGKEGERINFDEGLECEVVKKSGDVFEVQFNKSGLELLNLIEKIGQAPTPPYIKGVLNDKTLYQTVFAKEPGSAAAPTAGLHFTKALLGKLEDMGVKQEFVTLHVGLGTFQPIKTNRVEDHKIHTEWYSIDKEVLERIQQAKMRGNRIIAVGTTSVRVLETVFSKPAKFSSYPLSTISGETDIFIYPGYEFKIVDAMVTNFHTPYSSLLALVYAFAGQGFIQSAYQKAIEQGYRFFSFGDAMFIE